ncbi:MAG: SPOR domain-containing protein [Pseudomonadota bacterium]
METKLNDLGKELARLDSQSSARPKIVWIATVLVLLGAVLMMIWYAYHIGIREGSEEAAPTILAEGPIKIKPKHPGGMQVSNAGLQVMHELSGVSPATPPGAYMLPREPSPERAVMAYQQPGGESAITKTSIWRIQIGAFRDHQTAHREWNHYLEKAGSWLEQLDPYIIAWQSPNQGVFFRTQAGPLPSEQAAKALCDNLQSYKLNCIPVAPH